MDICRLNDDVSSLIRTHIIPSFAQAVLELVYNSVDAGATAISVDVHSDLSFCVSDNGHGIARQDLDRIALPFHTSKIHRISDLDSISTYGFRGQALELLATTGTVTIASAVKNEDTFQVRVRHGARTSVANVKSKGGPGTTVWVDQLYSRLPVRRRIMISQPFSTQLRQLKQLLIPTAIGFPNVSITVNGDKGRLFSIPQSRPGGGDPRQIQVLRALYGSISHSSTTETTDATGLFFQCKPQIQMILSQNRMIDDPAIYAEVNLDKGLSYIITVDNPHNVTALKELISSYKTDQAFSSGASPGSTPVSTPSGTPKRKASAPPEPPETPGIKRTKLAERTAHGGSLSSYFSEPLGDTDFKISQSALARSVPIAQVDNKFILTRVPCGTSSTLILIDQHAADERIQLEKEIKRLLVPEGNVPLALDSPRNIKVTTPLPLDQLTLWGIKYRIIDAEQVQVTHLPAIAMAKVDDSEFLLSLLTEPPTNLLTEGKLLKCPPALSSLIITKSCHNAIRFGHTLSLDDCRYMMRELAHCTFPFQCAHGRPSLVPLIHVGDTEQEN
uniref:ARAD1D19140p n=1 Tax=Blastobotrys adeninivorans TaxID=409370 RepID=A0A060TAH0_BLAAD